MHRRSLTSLSYVRWWIPALLAFAAVLNPQSGFARSAGNFSISHHTGIHAEPTTSESRHIIDEAEILYDQEINAIEIAAGRTRLAEFVSMRTGDLWFVLTLAILAAGLGVLHAIEPGHGKTIVAAYLAGSRATAPHAIWLGVIVTFAHTAVVSLLGGIALYASEYIIPQPLFPWFRILSGMIIAVVAGFTLARAWTSETGEHSHNADASHIHWFHSLPPEGQQSGKIDTTSSENSDESLAGSSEKIISLRQFLGLGTFAGFVPSPAALVILLSALSLHRVSSGLILIVAFSLGLAAALIATGLLMIYARKVLARWTTDGHWLPTSSATLMLALGVLIAGHALIQTSVASIHFAHGTLPPFVGIVLLGLFLGMRHSTDPDHVIAVSTIASREKSVGHGALIGVLWGIGHTLTIFLVGSAIILFGLVIPPRVGLSMEFCVALMLILLGVLNLTGALQWINARFSPAEHGDSSPGPSTEADAPASFLDRLLSRYGSYQIFRPLVIGLVHGLAGSAAVALLVLSTIHTPLWAIAYLLVFGIGTIIGMMLMTSAMAIPVVYTGRHFATANRYLTPISGIVSTAFGLVLLYQIGIVDGLFRANAHWTPQ